MATYVIGDLQGCFGELQRLLKKVRFDAQRDRLWFTGDLVNRGPKSLEVLRFVRALGERAVTVLGNHDLHLVAARLTGRTRKRDTLDAVLDAPDCDELIAWLRALPLIHVEGDIVLVHAGLPPQWTVSEAVAICAQASKQIASPRGDAFFKEHMYGDRPDRWSKSLRGWDRLRFVINCCTRMRMCTPAGRVDLDYKLAALAAPKGLTPWFAAPGRRSAGATVLFGHWSTLERVHWPGHKVYGLDTGCVWGRELTALRLDDRKLFAVKSEQPEHGSD